MIDEENENEPVDAEVVDDGGAPSETPKLKTRSNQTPIEIKPDGTPVYARDPKNHNRIVCGAMRRGEGKGQICKRTPASAGNGRCKLHGGRVPRGVNAGGFKHGRHSKHLAGGMLAKYNEAQSDPQLISLRSEIALMDARINDLLGKIDLEADETLWQKLEKAWDNYANKQPGIREIAKQEVEKIITQGINEAGTWREIYTAVDQRRKLVEGEIKRFQAMGQMITAERFAFVLSMLADLIKKNVTDKEAVKKITEPIQNMLVERYSPPRKEDKQS